MIPRAWGVITSHYPSIFYTKTEFTKAAILLIKGPARARRLSVGMWETFLHFVTSSLETLGYVCFGGILFSLIKSFILESEWTLRQLKFLCHQGRLGFLWSH